MIGAVRVLATVLGLAVLVAAWILYQGPVLGMMFSTTAFCQ